MSGVHSLITGTIWNPCTSQSVNKTLNSCYLKDENNAQILIKP